MDEQLRQRLLALQKVPGMVDRLGPLPLGVPAIDKVLGDGLMRGTLHEIAAVGEIHLPAAAGFALGLAVSAPSPRLFWITEDMGLAESGAPHGAGIDAFGLAPERLVTVSTAHRRDLLWAMEEALRCRAVGAVIGEMRAGEIGTVAVRRLSLAAAESGTLALLLRATPPRDASTAATRWIVGTASSLPGREQSERIFGLSNDREIRSRFTVHLVRNRHGPSGSWILEWSDNDERFILATHAQPMAAPAFNRSHRQVA
jgi:protein ImuA